MYVKISSSPDSRKSDGILPFSYTPMLGSWKVLTKPSNSISNTPTSQCTIICSVIEGWPASAKSSAIHIKTTVTRPTHLGIEGWVQDLSFQVFVTLMNSSTSSQWETCSFLPSPRITPIRRSRNSSPHSGQTSPKQGTHATLLIPSCNDLFGTNQMCRLSHKRYIRLSQISW